MFTTDLTSSTTTRLPLNGTYSSRLPGCFRLFACDCDGWRSKEAGIGTYAGRRSHVRFGLNHPLQAAETLGLLQLYGVGSMLVLALSAQACRRSCTCTCSQPVINHQILLPPNCSKGSHWLQLLRHRWGCKDFIAEALVRCRSRSVHDTQNRNPRKPTDCTQLYPIRKGRAQRATDFTTLLRTRH